MVIDENTRKEVLNHFPEKYHKLLNYQMLLISSTIEENSMNYKYSEDFRKAINLVLNDVLHGRYLGADLDES